MGQKLRLDNMGLAAQLWIFAITVLIGYSNPSSAALTQIQDPQKCPNGLCWEIAGLITQSDLKELTRVVDRLSRTKATPFFYLNSKGGDVEVAIAIGRQLRRFGATALTWDSSECFSSCVFILAGAVRRILAGKIGIHRPYSSRTDKRDYQAIQLDQRRLAKLAKDYLEEVNVSPSLYDAMVRVAPEKIKLLSKSELESYGLLEVDPVEQELEDAAEARKYGLSKVEFMRKKSQVDVICARELKRGRVFGDFDSYYQCRAEVFSSRR